MKKVSLLAATAAVLASTAVLAQTPPNCPKAFQGFFLGGNVGIGLGTGSQSVALFNTPVGGTITPLSATKNRLGMKGFDGGLNLGYNYRTGNWGLGLEFVANWTTSKGNFATTDLNANPNVGVSSGARLNNSLQLRGNFSYIIANLVAPKFIIGWDSSNFKINTNVAGLTNTANGAVPFNTERSKYLNGFLIGLGVDFLATKHFIIGMDTTVSMFDKTNFSRSFRNDDGSLVTHATSFKPEPYLKSSIIFKFIY